MQLSQTSTSVSRKALLELVKKSFLNLSKLSSSMKEFLDASVFLKVCRQEGLESGIDVFGLGWGHKNQQKN